MEINKEQKLGTQDVTAQDIAQINTFAKRDLTADEVYTFSVKLCDNEVDRDGERFPRETLEELGRLFVGKSGIFDHEWSAHGQSARIYRTELVEEERPTAAGDRYCYLKGCAYMLRSDKNADLIAEIEGGIKKEVSVGCSVRRSVCSVCGEDIGVCSHVKGRRYGGKLCFAELVGAEDAYEWSFVAVPAQREAGVLRKQCAQDSMPLRTIVRRFGGNAAARELERVLTLAALGEKHMDALRGEVRRLMLTADESMDGALVERMTEKLDEDELSELARVYRARTAKKLGLRTQLPGMGGAASGGDGNDFRI